MTHSKLTFLAAATVAAAAVALVPQAAAAASTGETCAAAGGSAVYLVAESVRTADSPTGGPTAGFPIEGTEIDTTIAETVAAGAQLSFPDGFDQTTFPETILIGGWATLSFERCGTAAPIDEQVDLSDNPEYRPPFPVGAPPAGNTSAAPVDTTAPVAAPTDTTMPAPVDTAPPLPAPTMPAPVEPAPTVPAPTIPAPTMPTPVDTGVAVPPPTRPTAGEEAGSEGTAVPLLATGGVAGAAGAVMFVLRNRRTRRP